MVSIWSIQEALRRFGRLTTSELATMLGVWTDDLSKPLRCLEAQGKVRRTGIKRMGKRKKMSIEWELTQKNLRSLKKQGCRTFYDLPVAKEQEKKNIKMWGRPFKRFY